MNKPLDEEDRLPYKFSKQTYDKADERTNVGDYEYDHNLSDVNTAVWHDHKHKKTHVSNRGSVTAYDWGVSDLQIATGTEGYGSRFQKAVDVTRKAHDKYGYNVSTSGHSLGGKLSAYTTEKIGDEDWYDRGTGFNQGNSTLGRDGFIRRQFSKCNSKNPPAYCSKQTNIKEKGDYVSQRNFACDLATFGMGGKMCTKPDAFGQTKTYDHRKNRRWTNVLTQAMFPQMPIRQFRNGTNHLLDVFDEDDRKKNKLLKL